MQFDWNQFVTANASAIFALGGALGGGFLSFIGAIALKRREFNLSMSGKLLERRISAHEKVITLATEMRVMVGLGGLSATGEVKRAPQIMMSREALEKWFNRFARLFLDGTTWLSPETKRELNLVQDYLVTLNVYLEGVASADFPALGELIRQDFIDLSLSLEKKAFKFFERGIRKLRLDSLDKLQKYRLVETERRLHDTSLLKNHDAFTTAAQTNGQNC